jgi:hypothetical protein
MSCVPLSLDYAFDLESGLLTPVQAGVNLSSVERVLDARSLKVCSSFALLHLRGSPTLWKAPPRHA